MVDTDPQRPPPPPPAPPMEEKVTPVTLAEPTASNNPSEDVSSKDDDDEASTGADSLQHSATSYQEDEKVVSSLEPSPAWSVRKTDSFVEPGTPTGTGLVSVATTDSALSGPPMTVATEKGPPLPRHHGNMAFFDASTMNPNSNNNNNINVVKSTIDNIQSRTNHPDPGLSQSAPVKNVSVPVPGLATNSSDAGSVGSVPSVLDSVGGGCMPSTSQKGTPPPPLPPQPGSEPPPLAAVATGSLSGHGHPPHQQIETPSEAPPEIITMQQQEQQQQQSSLQQQQQQQQVLVAVPQQSTVYYQVPSVVTLPVESGAPATAMTATQAMDLPVVTHQATPNHSRNPSSASLVTIAQPQMQLQAATVTTPTGQVGMIPVVKLQGGGLHYVKKKKGRFNVLQEAAPSEPQQHQQQQQQQQQSPIPNDITVPERSQSPMSAISHGASQPQTFDGKSAPTMKKKGRFVVTNVKNPGSIRNVPKGNGASKSPAADGGGGGGVSMESSSMGHQVPPQQPYLDTQVEGGVHHTIQPVMIQPIATMQATMQGSYDGQQYSHVPILHQSVPTEFQYNNVQYTMQHQYPQEVQFQQQWPFPESVAVSLPAHVPSSLPAQPTGAPHQQQPPLDTISTSAYSQPPPSVNQQHSRTILPQTSSGAAPTTAPQGGVTQGSNFELAPRRTDQTSTSLPNVPIPKVSVTAALTAPANKQPKNAAAAKKKRQVQPTRGGKVPQTIDSNGTWGSVGLGKVSYFLDQMKKEVTDTDRSIKTLQTDMRILRDKNKELEAKNRDLEKKLRDEKALREKAEGRNAELKRKLKEAKGESPASATSTMANVTEGVPLEEKETTRKRSDSFSLSEKPRMVVRSSTSPASGMEATKPPDASAFTPTKSKPTTTATSTGHEGSSSLCPSTHSMSSEVTKKAGTTAPLSARPLGAAPIKGKLNPSNSDSLQEDKPLDLEGDMLARSASMEGSVPPSPAKIQTPTISEQQKKVGEAPASTSAVPPLIPPLRQPKNPARNGASCHMHTNSMTDFDPFRSDNSREAAGLQTDANLVPFILPTSMSLSTFPAYAAPGSESMSMTSGFEGTFMTPNPFMVPVTIGMAPHPTSGADPAAGNGMLADHHPQQYEFTGIQQQQFMMVPQQQQYVTYHYEHPPQGTYAHFAPTPPSLQQAQQRQTAAPPLQQLQAPAPAPVPAPQQPPTQPINNRDEFDPMARR